MYSKTIKPIIKNKQMINHNKILANITKYIEGLHIIEEGEHTCIKDTVKVTFTISRSKELFASNSMRVFMSINKIESLE